MINLQSTGRAWDLPILAYHHLNVESHSVHPESIPFCEFESHLDILRRAGWTTLSFAELREALEGRRPRPNRAVWITFDDGYCSFLRAIPMLKARGMKATLFVVAGEIGKYNRWDVEKGRERLELMNRAQLRDAISEGIEIGSHGWAHRDLNECNQEEAFVEITRSRHELEDKLNVSVQAFAYPYGKHEPRHFGQLKEGGYLAAVSRGSVERSVTENRFAMRRVFIQTGDGRLRFRMKLAPLYLRYRAWRQS
jgi:peptidoglycan/xylan/chitin deacetylase (PgdA/CDA1 family)